MAESVVDVRALGFRLQVQQTHPLWPEMQSSIEEVRRRAFDLSVPFREFQDTWFENEKMIFDAEGIPAWPQLSPGYAAWKAVHFPGKPILQATGRLMASLTSLTGDTVYEVGPGRLVMGTAVEYSAKHQFGLEGMKQRVHVQMLEGTFQDLNSQVFLYVVDPFNRGR